MNIVMVLEIVVGIFVLAAVVRFAVRDTRQRHPASLEQQPELEHTSEVAHPPEMPEHGSEREADVHQSEVADRT